MSCSLPYSQCLEQCLVHSGAQQMLFQCMNGSPESALVLGDGNGSGKAFDCRGNLRELTRNREEKQRAQPVRKFGDKP